MKIFGKLLKAAAKLFSIVLMAVILLQLAGSVFGEHELPALFGYSCLSVLSGSMEPAVSAGDLIVIHRQTDYKNGDIITFSEDGFYTTHRIIASDAGGYRTKGDANNIQDAAPVRSEQVSGKVKWIIPKAGKLFLAVRSPLAAACIFLLGSAAWLLSDQKKTGEKGAGE